MTPLFSSAVRRLLLLGTTLSLTSCGLLVEAIVLESRRARAVPAGKALTGDGFVLSSPVEGYYPSRGEPTRGGVTLRNTDYPDDVYFVAPLKTSTARTADEALAEWNQRPAMHGQQAVVLRQSHTTFAGLPATRAVVDFPDPDRIQSSVTILLVVQRSHDFLVLACGGFYNWNTPTREDMLERSEKGLLKLQGNLTLTRR